MSFWRVVFLLAVLLVGVARPAQAQGPLPEILKNATFDQKMGDQIPLDLTFQNEVGQQVKLGDYLDGKPLILTLNYYDCPNLCPIVLDGLVTSLDRVSFNIGEDFNILTVSINPQETPELASKVKARLMRQYGRPQAEQGWALLTGAQAEIDALAKAVGFNYAYDVTDQQYAHPSGVIMLTPEGKIARYIYGVAFDSQDVRLALVEASEHKIGTPVDQVLLFCYRYDPAIGKYTPITLNIMRLGGVVTMVGLGLSIFLLSRHKPLSVEDLEHTAEIGAFPSAAPRDS